MISLASTSKTLKFSRDTKQEERKDGVTISQDQIYEVRIMNVVCFDCIVDSWRLSKDQ